MGLFRKSNIEELQTTFNEDGLDILVAEGSVENVQDENE